MNAHLTGRHKVAGTPAPEGIINPPIDDLLDVVDSKYGLVIMASNPCADTFCEVVLTFCIFHPWRWREGL